MGLGYLLFDYKVSQKLYALPDHKRSFWVYHFLIYHEFAHQLQFWNNDIEVRKTLKRMQNSKTPELAADCVAGALLRLLNLNLNDTIFETSFKGVLGATEALGDFHRTSYSHHGTPLDRTLAASFGSGFINKNKKLIQQNRFHISSGHLIHTCNQFVKKHLK